MFIQRKESKLNKSIIYLYTFSKPIPTFLTVSLTVPISVTRRELTGASFPKSKQRKKNTTTTKINREHFPTQDICTILHFCFSFKDLLLARTPFVLIRYTLLTSC